MRQRILAYLPRYPRKQAATLPALHIVRSPPAFVFRWKSAEFRDSV